MNCQGERLIMRPFAIEVESKRFKYLIRGPMCTCFPDMNSKVSSPMQNGSINKSIYKIIRKRHSSCTMYGNEAEHVGSSDSRSLRPPATVFPHAQDGLEPTNEF